MKVLSVRQPYAWLIVNGHKDIENRSRNLHYRGEILIHAGKKPHPEYWRAAQTCEVELGIEIPPWRDLPNGCIVGKVEITGVVTESDSPWFTGPYGVQLANAESFGALTHPFPGMLGLFNWDGLDICNGTHHKALPCKDPECWTR